MVAGTDLHRINFPVSFLCIEKAGACQEEATVMLLWISKGKLGCHDPPLGFGVQITSQGLSPFWDPRYESGRTEEERAAAMASDMRRDTEGFLAEGETSGSSLGGSVGPRTVLNWRWWAAKYPPHQVSQIQVRKYLPGSFLHPPHPFIHPCIIIKCLLYAGL